MRSLSRIGLVLLAVLVGSSAVAPSTASAAGTKYIRASCPNGAYAHIGGSGSVNITFYGLNSVLYSTSRNLGGGMSTVVYSPVPGSYNHVYVSGTGTIYSAGCS